jgi:hypothetical protein
MISNQVRISQRLTDTKYPEGMVNLTQFPVMANGWVWVGVDESNEVELRFENSGY